MTAKARPGRPTMSPGDAKSVSVNVRMTGAQRDEIRRIAHEVGVSVSEHMRVRALDTERTP